MPFRYLSNLDFRTYFYQCTEFIWPFSSRHIKRLTKNGNASNYHINSHTVNINYKQIVNCGASKMPNNFIMKTDATEVDSTTRRRPLLPVRLMLPLFPLLLRDSDSDSNSDSNRNSQKCSRVFNNGQIVC